MRNRTVSIIVWSSAIVAVVGLAALAAPVLASGGQSTTASEEDADVVAEAFEPTVEPVDTAEEAEGCTEYVKIRLSAPGPYRGYLPDELGDLGVSETASGPVGYDADGQIETYTVQPGDTMIGIGDRFCIDYITVAMYNDIYPSWEISPGDVVILHP